MENNLSKQQLESKIRDLQGDLLNAPKGGAGKFARQRMKDDIAKYTKMIKQLDKEPTLAELKSKLPVKDSNPFNLSDDGLKVRDKELKRIKKFGYGV